MIQRRLARLAPVGACPAISAAATEPDAAKRKALYSQIEDIILDQSAAMTVSLYPQTGLASAKVKGLSYDSRPGLNFAPVWLTP